MCCLLVLYVLFLDVLFAFVFVFRVGGWVLVVSGTCMGCWRCVYWLGVGVFLGGCVCVCRVGGMCIGCRAPLLVAQMLENMVWFMFPVYVCMCW